MWSATDNSMEYLDFDTLFTIDQVAVANSYRRRLRWKDSAALLHSMLTRATELSDTPAEKVQIESPFDRTGKSGRITS